MAVHDTATRTASSELDDDAVAEIARQLRIDSVRAADAAGSGHPTSSMSAAELVAELAARHLRFDIDDPEHPDNDHLVLSKGHASPLLYSLLEAIGLIDDDELLSFRRLGSRLEGHPTPRVPMVDVATGSLGQGPPIGVGIALAAGRIQGSSCHVWVLCGDSELAEGSVWEAAEAAGHGRVSNLTLIVDVNRLGQTGPTRHEWDLAAYAQRFQAFGWATRMVDGHDVQQIGDAYRDGRSSTRPTVILARTVKGKGATETADVEGKHGKPLDAPQEAIDELGGRDPVRFRPPTPERGDERGSSDVGTLELPTWDVGDEVATRNAYGEALVALGSARSDVVALDGEVGDSTRTEFFAEPHEDRFFQFFIAEQLMIGAAVGMQARGLRPFASSFAAFLTRAHDFLRMATVSRADLCVVGSHAGVSIGQDGPSQMGLEDLAMFRALHGTTVLYPCDANQAAALVVAMADEPGISYLRTSRGETPVIYEAGDDFPIGGSRVLRSGDDDVATVVAAGVTVHEALAAADRMAESGRTARVLDAYSVKPLDADAVLAAARATGGRVLVAEDHRAEGGLGDAVLEALAAQRDVEVRKLAVRTMPGSATPEEQRREAGIDADAIRTTLEGWAAAS